MPHCYYYLSKSRFSSKFLNICSLNPITEIANGFFTDFANREKYLIFYIGVVVLIKLGGRDKSPTGGKSAIHRLKKLRGIKMKGLIKGFSEIALFLGTLFIMYFWLGFIIVNLSLYANK